MYQHTEGTPAFDAVMAVEGKFIFRPQLDKEPNIEMLMVYFDTKTGNTWGTCPVKATMFSPKTLEALRAFLESAEEDFGQVVFGGGVIAPFGPVQNPRAQAESGEGPKLPPGLGEGG